MPTITRANRGAKAAADMPVSLAVTYEGKTKYVAVAPGMPTEALAKGLQHAFGKELKAAYGSVPYEIFAVTIDAEDEGEELVMLDVLARTPSIMHAAAAGAMQLVVTPDKPKKKRPLDKLYEALAALQLPLFSALLLCLARSFIVRPFLRALYRTGPAYRLGIGTLGFWEGAPLSVICASLTGTNDTRFWEANRKQCVSIFAQKEEGFLIAVEALALAAAYYMYRAEVNKKVAAIVLSLYSASSELLLERLHKNVLSAHKSTAAYVGALPTPALVSRAGELLATYKRPMLGALAAMLAALFILYGPLGLISL